MNAKTSLSVKKKRVAKGARLALATGRGPGKKRIYLKFPTVSFFSGCGGMDLGFLGGFNYKGLTFKQNPFEIIAAYDHEPKCLETYKLNISKNIFQKDLREFDPGEFSPAEVVIGGFPCQDFATCGPRRGLGSERGRLYRVLIEYAARHKPKVIVGENVPGLSNIGGGEVLSTIIQEIEDVGYRVKVWTLYAPDYGIPQTRTRLFIIGVRTDLEGFPEHPKETHSGNHRSIRWAIEDLEEITTEVVPNQSQFFLASPAKKGNGQGDEVSKADKPSYTIRANAKSRVQFHYALKRRLTVRECARLQTFPDNFVFPHSATASIRQIGNAVPPVLGHFVARSVARFLNKVVEKR